MCGVNPCPQVRREPISKSRTYSLVAALAAAITLIATSAAQAKVHWRTVGASWYGGSGDPYTSGAIGYQGDELKGTNSYAELGNGFALGGLPYKQKLRISYRGRTVTALKRDIGGGGDNVFGYSRAIDLWCETAQKLGFTGTGLVKIRVIGKSKRDQ